MCMWFITLPISQKTLCGQELYLGNIYPHNRERLKAHSSNNEKNGD